MTPYQQQNTPQPLAEPEGSTITSTTTLPPLEAEFLAELDFSGGGGGMNGMMIGGDGIDWDALMNDGGLWNSIGGGWSDGVLDEQSLR